MGALTVGALALRVVGLDRNCLWFDEAFSLMLITSTPLPDWRLDVHPPLYYLLLWGWARVSTADAWLRLLSSLLGTATIPAMYALGARLLGRSGGLWAAAFLAVTWFHVWYSRDARMYALLVLMFTLALWGLVAGARDGERRGWIVYALAGAAVAWSHAVGIYYAALLAGLAPLVPRGHGRGGTRRPWLVATAVLALLYAPWVPVMLARSREKAQGFWVSLPHPEPPVLTTIHQFTVKPIPPLANLLRSHLGLDLGAGLGAWIWMVPVLAGLGLAVALARPQRRWLVRLLTLAYLLPIALFTAASLVVRPILIPRILLPVVVPLVLLLAVGVEVLPRRWARRAGGLALGGVLLLAAAYGVRHDRALKEGWREASHYVQAHARPGDVLLDAQAATLTDPRYRRTLQTPSTAEFLFLRYDDTGRVRSLPWVAAHRAGTTCQGDIAPCLDAALRSVAAGGHVWFIRRGGRIPDYFRPWFDARLEEGPVAEFDHVFVERRRLRLPAPG